MLFSCKNEWEQKEEYFEEEIKPKLVEKYKCYGVDDCLSKYEFQGARDFASEIQVFSPSLFGNEVMEKIVRAESIYWLNEKEYDRAYKTVLEFKPSNTDWSNAEMERQYDILDDIISSLISDKEFDKALLWVLKASDQHNIEGWKKSDTSNWNDQETQQKILLKKITTAKKILSKK